MIGKQLFGSLVNSPLLYSVLRQLSPKVVLPFYHLATDHPAPHIKYLYKFHNTQTFEQHIDFLLRDFCPISLQTIINILKGNENIGSHKYFMLSFDDGMREIYDEVVPILNRKGVPAAFFLNPGFIDNKTLFYRHKASLLIDALERTNDRAAILCAQDKLRSLGISDLKLENMIMSIPYSLRYALDDIAPILGVNFEAFLKNHCPYMSKTQCSYLRDTGHALGGHSIDHPNFAELSLEQQIHQSIESTNMIQQWFNLDYRAFAFPYSDRSVSVDMFNELAKQKIDISFGTAGFIEDSVPFNFQRLWLENLQSKTIQAKFSSEFLRLGYKKLLKNGKDNKKLVWK